MFWVFNACNDNGVITLISNYLFFSTTKMFSNLISYIDSVDYSKTPVNIEVLENQCVQSTRQQIIAHYAQFILNQ